MKLILDIREDKLIKILESSFSENTNSKNITLETQQLPLADAIIQDNEGNELVYIERKSICDLAASIKDNRYTEQSYRLNNHPIPNHNIIYIIEGSIENYKDRYSKSRITPKTLYSAVISLQLFKGFSVMKTSGLLETAEYIERMAEKLQKELKNPNGKRFYFTLNNSNKKYDVNVSDKIENIEYKSIDEMNITTNYVDVMKKIKKNNITKDNIGEIMLSQIPSVSSTIAKVIMEKFKNLDNLIIEMKKNKDCLKNIMYQTKTGKSRRISQTSISNIFKFLINNDEGVLQVVT